MILDVCDVRATVPLYQRVDFVFISSGALGMLCFSFSLAAELRTRPQYAL